MSQRIKLNQFKHIMQYQLIKYIVCFYIVSKLDIYISIYIYIYNLNLLTYISLRALQEHLEKLLKIYKGGKCHKFIFILQ